MDGSGWYCVNVTEQEFQELFLGDNGGGGGTGGDAYEIIIDVDASGLISGDNPLEVGAAVPDCSAAPQDRINDAANLICAQLGTMGCVGTSLIGTYWRVGFNGGSTYGIYKWARPMQSTLPLDEVQAPDCSI